jgi:hypothetical protein
VTQTLGCKTIVLCADDFGLNSGISEGILRLVALQRLSAVSCIVNSQGFMSHAQKLLSYNPGPALGLHFNLTEGTLLTGNLPFNLASLLLKTHLHRVDKQLIESELQRQLDAFVDVVGRLPDFIDGHQHVHQFPQIRSCLLALYEKRLKGHSTLRATYPSPLLYPFVCKTSLLALTGGMSLHRKLKKRAIPHYASFAGIYDFSQKRDYGSLFRRWLALVPTNTLIMCHPGEDRGEADGIAGARQTELNYFMSDVFLRDCADLRVLIRARGRGGGRERPRARQRLFLLFLAGGGGAPPPPPTPTGTYWFSLLRKNYLQAQKRASRKLYIATILITKNKATM